MQSDKLLQSLIEQTEQIVNQVDELLESNLKILCWKQNEQSWSILECLEHLNLYGDYYFPIIEQNIKTTSHKSEIEFKTGFLGNYFSKLMLPKEKLKKMKTFKDKNPLNSNLDKRVIDRFIEQQKQLLSLLNESKSVSLNKVRIPTSISSLIKLKLGDTFQFIVNHNLRHLNQIERIKKALNNIGSK